MAFVVIARLDALVAVLVITLAVCFFAVIAAKRLRDFGPHSFGIHSIASTVRIVFIGGLVGVLVGGLFDVLAVFLVIDWPRLECIAYGALRPTTFQDLSGAKASHIRCLLL